MRARYTIRLEEPHHHVIGVEAVFEGLTGDSAVVGMPQWVPGHYAMQNNARFVQDLEARVDGRRVAAVKVDNQRWQIATRGAKRLVLRYDVFGHHLGSSACFFDDSQCQIHGGAAFLYVLGHQDAPCELVIARAPAGWKVATGLRPAGRMRWRAPTYDDLIDCPVKVGRFHHESFRVRGVLHHVVVSDLGDTAKNLPRLVKDTKAFVGWVGDMFGGFPYRDYWFLYDLSPTRCKGGALEHKNSTHLALQLRLDSQDPEDYAWIVAVGCHEYFHTWNVKRIRPQPLGPFDLTCEQHTTDLWIAEGLTDYYAWYALRRAGVHTPKEYLGFLGRYVDRLHDMPGRGSMTLREASWETWNQSFWTARHSAEETNSLNRFVDYYTKGAIVGALLDVELRAATGARKGLEDVFRALWKTWDRPEGFPQGEFEDVVERIGGKALRRTLEGWVGSTKPLDYAATFKKAGLVFEFAKPSREEDGSRRRRKILGGYGLELDDKGEFPAVVNVIPGTPAARAGVNRGDQLLAADGTKLTREAWARLLKEREPGDPLVLDFFRYEHLRRTRLVPERDRRLVARFATDPRASKRAKAVGRAWLGSAEPVSTHPAGSGGAR
jgi:predicted metalloprotease with PDZ domain